MTQYKQDTPALTARWDFFDRNLSEVDWIGLFRQREKRRHHTSERLVTSCPRLRPANLTSKSERHRDLTAAGPRHTREVSNQKTHCLMFTGHI